MRAIEKRNLVAHYYDPNANSDKVYMACVRQDGSRWLVIGKWGRRGKNISSQVKLTTQVEKMALLEQRNLFNAKLREGYVDIESPNYNGTLTMQSVEVRDNLEPEANEEEQLVEKKSKSDSMESATGNSSFALGNKDFATPEYDLNPAANMVAVCLNNSGAEEKFDVGVEYVFETHKDKSMIWVWDKFGVKGEFFKERFKLKKA